MRTFNRIEARIIIIIGQMTHIPAQDPSLDSCDDEIEQQTF